MKHFQLAVLLCACLVWASVKADEANTENKGFGSIFKPIRPILKPIKPIIKPIQPPVSQDHIQQKRFLGSILKPILKPINNIIVKPINNHVIKPINNNVLKPVISGVNNVVLKPINNVILKPVIGGAIGAVVGGATIVASGVSNVLNHVANGVTTAVTVITDPLLQFGNELLNVVGSVSNVVGNQITNAVTGALGSLTSVVLPIILPNKPIQTIQQDPCGMKCFSRVLVNNVETDFFFDKPNGCIAKGVNDRQVDQYFAGCCNQHSACLNSKCCTGNCQELKNQCDQEYLSCYRKACLPYYDDHEKYMVCSAIGSQLVAMSRERVCSITNKASRKLCFCESD